MPSGRKGRGSRRRSHKQHQKQKLEELSDYDQGSNLSHGPLPDSIPSPWTIEPLPPCVEGPPVLKQDAETVESLPGGIHRKEAAPQKALRVQIPARLKRKKGSTVEVAADSGATNSATALDRWDCGNLQADETLAYFYPSRVELEAAAFELKSSNDKVEVLANGTGNKDLKGDGNMKKRKWKIRPEVAAGNRSSTVIDALGPGQQVEASSHNVSMHTKHNATHQRSLSELEECNETDKSTLDVGMNAAKEQELGSSAFEMEKLNSVRGGSLKRGEKGPESGGAAAQLSHTFKTDVHKVESEWKGGKANDSGLSSSPKLPVLRLKRSEGSQKSQRSEDSVQAVGRDDAEGLEKLQYAAGKGTNWILTEDNRNPELEKELENRIRRRRGESGEKEKWREDDKEKDMRRHHHQIEERHKDETRRRENEEEKPKEDGVEAEKDRSDSRQKDEKYKENRYMESKLNEEKQKTDRNRELPCRDDKECDENHNSDRDKEERTIDRKLRGDRDKVEKKKDNRQKEDRDAKWKDNFRDDRCRVDKDKEGRVKDEKVPDYRHKEQRLKDERQRSEDRFECHKEENSWGGRLQDEKEKQVRQRDKVDRPKDRDKEERLETIKEEKLRDEGGKNPSREDLKDEKGSHGKKKGQKEQEDTTRPDKLHGKRHKTDKRQDGRDIVGREKVDSKRRGDRERESRQKEAIAKDEKQQAYKDGNENQKNDYRPKDDRVKPEKVEDDRNRADRQRDERVDRGEKSKGEKVDVDRLIDSRERAEREKGDLERLADVNRPGDKEDNQREVYRKSSERFDGRKEDEKQGDGWQTKDSGLFDMDRDFHLSQDEPGIQSKDLADPVLARKTHERQIRRDREAVEKHTVQEGDRRGAKTSRDDAKDQERAFSLLSSSGASVPHKPERQLKRTRNFGSLDSVITEKIHERSSSKRAEAENDLPLDDNKVLHRTQEDTLSAYDCSPQSPSPSLPSGTLPPSSEKPARRTKFETSISVSSSSGTRWVKERNRHIIEQTYRIKQHRALEEEVKSWDLRGTNQDSDDGRGWSLSPDKNWDAFSSLPLDSAKDEYSRVPMRGHEDSYVPEQEHRKFPQGGGPSKARQARLHQSSQINRAPMGGPMVRPQVQTRLLPPPPPFRPGIDNPDIIGSYNSGFDEGLGSRESGRYDRKSGGAFKRSEMGGPGETWRGVGVGVVMGMGMGNWNAQNPGPGPGPGNMFAPFAQIGGHPSVGYLGMAQQFPVPPLYGPGSARPPADMGFGDGTRYHVGDARVCFPQGPNHGPVMGWQRPAEPDEKSPPLVDMWGGQGHYIGERHRFGYLEWDQADKGMTGRWERGPDLWQGQAGDVSTGFNLPRFQREASCQGSVAGETSTFCEDNDQKIEDLLQEIPDTADPQKVSPADPADVVMSVVPQAELKSTVRSSARLTQISLNLDVSDKLVSNDLYKQYLSLLPASKAKERETSVLQCEGSHGPMEEDLEFEVDLEAQKLLSTLVPYADLLPQLSNNAFKEALAIYHRPIQDTCVQKSVFGSFILPVDFSLIKMPNLGVDLDTVRVGQLEASGDQPCSSNAFDSPLSAGNESLIGASRLMENTLQEETEQVQDNQGLSLVQAEFSMGRCVEIVPRVKQQGVAEVSFKQGAYGGTALCRDEDITINVDMPAHQLPSAVVVNCKIGLDISVVEANVELSAEIQTGEDDNTRRMEVVQLDCKGGEWPTRQDDKILVEHCSKCFQQGGREQHTEVAQSLEEEDGVDPARQTSVRTEERQRVLKPEFQIDEIKINCRPQKSSENACENTH